MSMAMKTEQRDYLQEHLPYMLKMLRYTYGQMLQEQHYLSWNAHFESFSIHARNLTRFLSNKDRGNFKAAEFVKDYKASFISQSNAPRMSSPNSTLKTPKQYQIGSKRTLKTFCQSYHAN